MLLDSVFINYVTYTPSTLTDKSYRCEKTNLGTCTHLKTKEYSLIILCIFQTCTLRRKTSEKIPDWFVTC